MVQSSPWGRDCARGWHITPIVQPVRPILSADLPNPAPEHAKRFSILVKPAAGEILGLRARELFDFSEGFEMQRGGHVLRTDEMSRFDLKFVFWGFWGEFALIAGLLAVLSAGTAKPSNSAPVCPFDPASVVMLVMPKDTRHSCRYLFTGSETVEFPIRTSSKVTTKPIPAR